MTRFLTAAVAATVLVSGSALAAPRFHDAGPNLTLGGAPIGWTTLSSVRNPAASEFAIAPGATFRTAIVGSLGVSAEVGDVDNFIDDIDRLIDALDEDNLSLAEGNALANEFNDLLPVIGRDGYLTVQAGMQVPLFPIIVRTGVGVFTLDANLSAQAGLSVLDSPVTYNPVREELETSTSLYIKGVRLTELSLGYARPVWQNGNNSLVVGGRLKYLQAAMSKQVIALETVGDDDAEDVVRDSWDENERTSSNLTADLGVVFAGANYRIGLTLANLTEPEFDYGRIGADCDKLTGNAQFNCYTAASFADRINLSETWTLERLATAEAAFLFANGAGSVSISVDLNEVNDPVGAPNQWLAAAVAYMPESTWVPGARVGYRKNLAGSELSMITAGLSFFKRVHLDVAYGLESTKVDGNSVPRVFAFNLGIETSF